MFLRPLPAYNSLADQHLAGYFTNTRMRRHLRKAGLVNKYGEIVTENTYRLNMSRREHKQHVKDMLAQAIVHKTLDLERTRQAEIRRKLEEIAKIELVRRVRADRKQTIDDALLPLLSPRAKDQRSASVPRSTSKPPLAPSSSSSAQSPPRRRRRGGGGERVREINGNISAVHERVVYLDDEGRPITPAHVDEANLRYASKDPIDTRHLYSLDTAALRKYALLMAKMEQGRGGASPYLIPQVPLPPKSPKSSRGASARRTPRSAQRDRGEQSKSSSPKRPSTANQAYLHPASGVQKFKGQQETMCKVSMVYHGSSLSLAREMLPGRSKQDVVVEQQHCGGNTLNVFRDCLERGSNFSFISYRHRGYPFSLSIYIDGKMDCRVSTCCEYRHHKGGRIGGKKGHFSISGIQGAVPCYKCQVEKGIRVGNQAPRPKLKRPPEHHEEVVVVETARESEPPKPEPEPVAEAAKQEHILVPVEDGEEQKADDKYDDDDFESSASDSSSAEEEEYAIKNPQTPERGEDEFVEGFKPRHHGRRRHQTGVDKKTVAKSSKRDRPRNVGKDSNTDSSCGEDDRYYKYKQRMLRKTRSESESSLERSESSRSRQPVSAREDGSIHDDRTYSASARDETKRKLRKPNSSRSEESSQAGSLKSHPRDSGKKRSSTYSGPGQAEPVRKSAAAARSGETGCDAGDDRRGTAADAANTGGECGRGERGGRGGRNHLNAGDTADEVSDIESEMAASPRKFSHAGNQCEATEVPYEVKVLNEGSDEKNRSGKDVTIRQKSNANRHRRAIDVNNIHVSKQTKNANIEKNQSVSGEYIGSKKDFKSNRLDDIVLSEEDKIKKTNKSRGRKEHGSKVLDASLQSSGSGRQKVTKRQDEHAPVKQTMTSINGNENESLVDKDAIRRDSPDGQIRKTEIVGNSSEKFRSGVSPNWENVLDAAEGKEAGGLQLNLDPKEQSVERGDRGLPLTDREVIISTEERDSDKRGARLPHDPGQWTIYQHGRPLETNAKMKNKTHVGDNSVDDSEERAGLNDGSEQKVGKKSTAKPRSETGRSGVSCKQVNSILDQRDFSKNTEDQINSSKTTDAHKEQSVSKDSDGEYQNLSLNYEGKPLFTSKITSIPMSKTGENKYLKRQANEMAEAQRRIKSESLKENLKDSKKRHGQHYGDLSYPAPIVRGFVGDSLSDEDEDETYSRLGPKDDRADLFDQDKDVAGPKNYVLAGATDVSVAVSSTSSLSHKKGGMKEESFSTIDVVENGNSIGYNYTDLTRDVEAQPDAPTYRVLLDDKDIATRKPSALEEIERQKVEEEKRIQALNEKDDVRGKTRSSGKAKTRSSRHEGLSKHDPEVHPSLREAGSKQYRRDPETYYSPKYPRLDSEGSELDVTTGGESGGSFRHPQLKAHPQSKSDTLAFRHSFVEEPAPMIFRPGIDDKDKIQCHVTPRNAIDLQHEAIHQPGSDEVNVVDAEDMSNDKDRHMNINVSFEGDGTKQQHTDSNNEGCSSVATKCTTKDLKEEDNKSSSSSSSSDSTSSSSSSSSECTDKAELKIVGTRYVDKEGARYARHHKAFDEAPLVGYQEFTESGGTLSVLSPCDRSGLPVETYVQGKDDINNVDTVDSGGGGDPGHQSEVAGNADYRDEMKFTREEIPCLSVNTPGPEYDQNDREFQKLQLEKKRFQKAQADEKVLEHDSCARESNYREYCIQSSTQGQHNFQPLDLEPKIKTDNDPESFSYREERVAEYQNDDDTGNQSSTVAAASKENEVVQNGGNSGLVEPDSFHKKDENVTHEETGDIKATNNVTGTDLMEMYLGRRRSSSAAVEISRQCGEYVIAMKKEDSIKEESEEKPASSSSFLGGRDEKMGDTPLDVAASGKEPEKLALDQRINDEDGLVLPDAPKAVKSPRHRESVTATNLMDLWLGGDRARQSMEKMDQVMHHVSDGESSMEEISDPGASVGADSLGTQERGDAQVASFADVVDGKQDEMRMASHSADHAEVIHEGDAVAFETSQIRRDSSSHAEKEDSDSCSSRDGQSAMKSSKLKKIKKLKSKEGVESKLKVEESVQEENKIADARTDKNNPSSSELNKDADALNDHTPRRKSSVPDVFIITAEGDKFASIVNPSNEDEVETGPVCDGNTTPGTKVYNEAMPEVSLPALTNDEANASSPENSPSDISGVDALIECLEKQLSEGKNTPQATDQEAQSKITLRENNHVESPQEGASSEQEVDALLLKLDILDTLETKEPVVVLGKTEKTEGDEMLLSENKQKLFDNLASYEDGQLGEVLSPHHITSQSLANEIAAREHGLVPEHSLEEKSGVEISTISCEPTQAEIDSLASLDDAETISGQDEDDAARRYVERILQSVTEPGSQLHTPAGSLRIKNSSPSKKRDSGSLPDDSQVEYTELIGIVQDQDLIGFDKGQGDDAAEGDPRAARRASTLQVAGSEHSERRKQRKLTVSFAVDDGDDNDYYGDDHKSDGKNRKEVDEVPWESVDEQIKEDEYDRLERQLERSLQIN
ncbi:glutamate-rich 3 [Elysia marginata]|uniref:Glutamate-rich 3 n=1 Tax=Elysia marginata TaxID=1093978 RepID=A0AAV4HXY3_9GAST|nr:glutamate-rich 3 [Elysia marginata]